MSEEGTVYLPDDYSFTMVVDWVKKPLLFFLSAEFAISGFLIYALFRRGILEWKV